VNDATLGLHGASLGWRPETAWLIHRRKDLAFTEVVAENLCAGALPAPLAQLRRRGVTLIPHAVSLSLGSVEGYSRAALDHLARIAEQLESPLVSEHVAFVRAGGVEAGHLLPVARSERMLDVIAENVRQVRRVLPVPLALEHIATLFEWPDAEMDEATFVGELLDRTGCRVVLDLANLYANAQNHGSDPLSLLGRLSREQVAYVHVAGGRWQEGLYHDTHGARLDMSVLALLAAALERLGPLPVLIERDDDFGTRWALEAELDEVAALVARAAEPDPSPASAVRAAPERALLRGSAHSDLEQQLALVESLVLERAAPPGFDPRRFAAASRALGHKFARTLAKQSQSVKRRARAFGA